MRAKCTVLSMCVTSTGWKMFSYIIFSFINIDWSCIYRVQKLYEFQDVQEKIVMLSVRFKILKHLHFTSFMKILLYT